MIGLAVAAAFSLARARRKWTYLQDTEEERARGYFEAVLEELELSATSTGPQAENLPQEGIAHEHTVAVLQAPCCLELESGTISESAGLQYHGAARGVGDGWLGRMGGDKGFGRL